MNEVEIQSQLEGIVGPEFVSSMTEERFIYARDPGASVPRHVDFVVLPRTVEEVQKVLQFANEARVPVVPLGGGMTLSGLVIPLHGGIVLDMKRMDRILEVNESSQYALIEPGVTSGMLMAYLNQHHSHLQISIPDAPPAVTITGNVLIHGSGSLSQLHGNHASMVNGVEVVLPTGEIVKSGSCSVSDYWFSRGPLPDIIGILTSGFGTLGVVTKLAIRLYPMYKIRDIVPALFPIAETDKIPNVISTITRTGVVEDFIVGAMDKPDWMKGYLFALVFVTADEEEEFQFKAKMLKQAFRKAKITAMNAPERLREAYLEKPQFAARTADFRKGGGFEYVGAMFPLERISEVFRRGFEIARKFGYFATMGCRMIDGCHNILYFTSYPFNRADPKDMQLARDALDETNRMALELGGIPWKAEYPAQQMILERMDPNYKNLFFKLRRVFDPNGIMNPGNWEVKK